MIDVVLPKGMARVAHHGRSSDTEGLARGRSAYTVVPLSVVQPTSRWTGLTQPRSFPSPAISRKVKVSKVVLLQDQERLQASEVLDSRRQFRVPRAFHRWAPACAAGHRSGRLSHHYWLESTS
jgi:hypothetical protein